MEIVLPLSHPSGLFYSMMTNYCSYSLLFVALLSLAYEFPDLLSPLVVTVPSLT